jgi:hypothetical protein
VDNKDDAGLQFRLGGESSLRELIFQGLVLVMDSQRNVFVRVISCRPPIVRPQDPVVCRNAVKIDRNQARGGVALPLC